MSNPQMNHLNDSMVETTSVTDETPSHTAVQMPILDEEGLYTQYDVVLCGTGLVQSILASALARYSNTIKILHIDGADHYGNLDAVYTYPYLLSQYEKQRESSPTAMDTASVSASSPNRDNNSNENFVVPLHPMGEVSTLQFHSVTRTTQHCILKMKRQVETPYGTGIILNVLTRPTATNTTTSDIFVTLVIQLTHWTLANQKQPKLYVGIPSSLVKYDAKDHTDWYIDDHQCMWDKYRIRTVTAFRASQILDQYSRSLALDITPYLLYAAGPAVDGLLTSTVSNYIEFKSLDALLYYTPPPPKDGTVTQRNGTFTRVPCSKKDVFASHLLSPMDKRRLMKFLHLALDYAGAIAAISNEVSISAESPTGEEIMNENVTDELQSWNERYLNQGRSLVRPQNKVVESSELQHLQELRKDPNQTFRSYLQQDQKFSTSLTSLIQYALALDTKFIVDDDRSSGTTVAQGMEQLCAHIFALGRFGTTAFLVPLYGSGELSQAFCRSAAVYGTTYLLRRAPIAMILERNDVDSTFKVCGVELSPAELDESSESSPIFTSASSKRISCTHIVLPTGSIQEHIAPSSTRMVQRVLRRISIVTGKPIQLDGKNGQDQQRHVLIIPPNSISSKQAYAIQGVVVDESVSVAPQIPSGCTVLHLTTIVDYNVIDVGIVDDNVLSEAVLVIMQGFHNPNDENVVEIFHTSFSYEVCVQDDSDRKSVEIQESVGLHLIQRSQFSLTADTIFKQAANIFRQICPNASNDDFLKVSQATTDSIKAALGENIFNTDDEDDDDTALKSAMGIIERPKPDT
jgi:Rab proteins geranylgeranyltransferase component A